MASTYLILSSILLVATQVQGQCPLGSCSLVSQVNICTNVSARASELGCSDSTLCVMALRESTTVEECCNKIVESIDNVAPTSEQSGSICDEAGALFGDSLNFVNTAQFLQREIHAGTYIVPQSDFIYSCDGFIKSITLAVSPNSVLKDAQGQERLRFHTFTDKAGDGSIYQRREDAVMWNSSIANTSSDRRIVNYRPIGSTQLCFNQGDVFGFTIEAGSDITILTRFPSDSNRLVQNVSSDLETLPGCPQLSDSGLYATMEGFSSTPLIHIKTEGFLGPPTEPPLTTTTELLTTQPYSAGSIGVLNSKITGAPVISIATDSLESSATQTTHSPSSVLHYLQRPEINQAYGSANITTKMNSTYGQILDSETADDLITQ